MLARHAVAERHAEVSLRHGAGQGQAQAADLAAAARGGRYRHVALAAIGRFQEFPVKVVFSVLHPLAGSLPKGAVPVEILSVRTAAPVD